MSQQSNFMMMSMSQQPPSQQPPSQQQQQRNHNTSRYNNNKHNHSTTSIPQRIGLTIEQLRERARKLREEEEAENYRHLVVEGGVVNRGLTRNKNNNTNTNDFFDSDDSEDSPSRKAANLQNYAALEQQMRLASARANESLIRRFIETHDAKLVPQSNNMNNNNINQFQSQNTMLMSSQSSQSQQQQQQHDDSRRRQRLGDDAEQHQQQLQEPTIKQTLTEPWFSLINEGKKTIEGRLNKTWVSTLKIGDTIEFTRIAPENEIENEKGATSQQQQPKTVTVFVTNLRRYNSFKQLFDEEGLESVLPGVKSKEEGVEVYRKFYTEEAESQYGVVGIFVKKLITTAGSNMMMTDEQKEKEKQKQQNLLSSHKKYLRQNQLYSEALPGGEYWYEEPWVVPDFSALPDSLKEKIKPNYRQQKHNERRGLGGLNQQKDSSSSSSTTTIESLIRLPWCEGNTVVSLCRIGPNDRLPEQAVMSSTSQQEEILTDRRENTKKSTFEDLNDLIYK